MRRPTLPLTNISQQLARPNLQRSIITRRGGLPSALNVLRKDQTCPRSECPADDLFIYLFGVVHVPVLGLFGESETFEPFEELVRPAETDVGVLGCVLGSAHHELRAQASGSVGEWERRRVL